MLSEKIANEIMTEIHEVVKDFVSDTIADRRSASFDDVGGIVLVRAGRHRAIG